MMYKRSLRFALLCLLTVALTAAVTLAVKYWPRTVPLKQCSEVYQRYYDLPGVEASFVKGYRINSTLTADVTLFKAADSLTFVQLLRKFCLSDHVINAIMTMEETGIGHRSTGIVPKHDFKQLPDANNVLNNYIMATVPRDRTVAFFEVYDEATFDRILLGNAHEQIAIPLIYKK